MEKACPWLQLRDAAHPDFVLCMRIADTSGLGTDKLPPPHPQEQQLNRAGR